VELPADEIATKAVARVSRDDGSKEMHACMQSDLPT
jgi:hypothetical protein